MRPMARFLTTLASLMVPATVASSDIVEPGSVPQDVQEATKNALEAERAALVGQRDQLAGLIAAHDAQCGRVRSDAAAAVASCQASQANLIARLNAYDAALDDYEKGLRKAPRVPRRVFRQSGNGLIAGTSWQLGYYSPIGASPEVRARARELVRDQARRAGIPYEEKIDFDRYDFVIGLAKEADQWRDLTRRVMFEQLLNGRATAKYQEPYNSLRDRQFGQLDCHSNGAMICLAALTNRDVRADDVILFGPQITTDSLELWNQLLAERRIRSLKIIMAQNDPIPPASLLFAPGSLKSPALAALSAPLLFRVDTLAFAVGVISPGARVETFPCSGAMATFECHDLGRYSAYLKSRH